MSHTRVKTTYEIEGPYGSTDYETLYCDHNHTSNIVTFYDQDGEISTMCFQEWSPTQNDKWEAMLRLMYPFIDNNWLKPRELKPGVEFYLEIGD